MNARVAELHAVHAVHAAGSHLSAAVLQHTDNVQALLQARYAAVRCLSSSALASVWWVDGVHGPVVVKIFPVQAQAAYRREAALALGLTNAYVVPCLDTFVLPGGSSCLVYEYMAEGSLADLATKASLGTTQIRRLACQTLHGLVAIHAAGYIHCDIKPSNVLIACNPATGALDFRLADLGSAATLREARSGQHGIGSPAYCAPERLYNQFGSGSDLYSTGIMLFEMLCGHLPFMGSVEEIYRAHITRPAPLGDVASIRWREWLARMLAKSPRERFACAQDAIDALPSDSDALLPLPPAAARVSLALPVLLPAQSSTQATPEGSRTNRAGMSFQLAEQIRLPCEVDTVVCNGSLVVVASHRGLLQWHLESGTSSQLSAATPPCVLEQQKIYFSSAHSIIALTPATRSRVVATQCQDTLLALAVHGPWLAMAEPRKVSIQNTATGEVACVLRHKHYALQPILQLQEGRFALSGGLGNHELWIRNFHGDVEQHVVARGPWLGLHLGSQGCTAVCAPMDTPGTLEIHRIAADGKRTSHAISTGSLHVSVAQHGVLYLDPFNRLAWHDTTDSQEVCSSFGGVVPPGARAFLSVDAQCAVVATSDGNQTFLQRWLLSDIVRK